MEQGSIEEVPQVPPYRLESPAFPGLTYGNLRTPRFNLRQLTAQVGEVGEVPQVPPYRLESPAFPGLTYGNLRTPRFNLRQLTAQGGEVGEVPQVRSEEHKAAPPARATPGRRRLLS